MIRYIYIKDEKIILEADALIEKTTSETRKTLENGEEIVTPGVKGLS